MNFNDIYVKYFKKIFIYCYAKLKDYKLAEDCAQDVFLALYKKMNKLKLNTNIEAWLYKAAQYQIKIYFRKKRNEISIEEVSAESELVNESEIQDSLLSDILNEEELKVITEFYVSGESIDKIAEESKLSKAAAYQKIRRIKQKTIQYFDKRNKLSKN